MSTHAHRVDESTELFIDALRGVAALMVFMTHAVDLAVYQAHGWSFAENPPFWRTLRAVFGTGEQWVWAFFVLSGFCIQLSITRSLREGTFRFWPYLLARVTRIYPLFLVGFALAGVTYWLVPDLGGYDGHKPGRQFWATLVNLQIFTNPFPGFEPSWSLSCEMIYYVAWPVLLMMAGMREKRAFWLGMGGSLTVAGAVLILWKVFHRMEDRAFVDGIWSVSALFVLWLAGARLMVDWERVAGAVTRAKWGIGLGVAAAASGLLFVMRYQSWPPWTTHLAAWTAMPGLVLMIAGARHLGLAGASARVKAACRWLGLFSYPCYILHDQMLRLVDHYAEEWLPASWARMPLEHLVVSFVVVLPPLVLVGPALERFFMGWRSRVLRQVAAKAVERG